MSNDPLHPYVSLIQKDMDNLHFILGMIEKDGDYEYPRSTSILDLEVVSDAMMFIDKSIADTLTSRLAALRAHYVEHVKVEVTDAQALRRIRECFIERNYWTMATGVLESNLDETISIIREECEDKLKRLREDYVKIIKMMHKNGEPISDSDLEFTWAI
ncbi:MAG: hypothetical protein CMN60_21150 [Sphingobium sp.]|nr:hypothetical protein [Sphingobium sp.]MBS50139.1 hypothetical protein [Sphingobium sp.]|tara:strand:- start:253253 stop:253729 length:477 start_codon:yes stop_codon:yes gene_type:complete